MVGARDASSATCGVATRTTARCRSTREFIVNRFRKAETHTFVGRYTYRLRPLDDAFGIRKKTATSTTRGCRPTEPSILD